MKNAARKIVTFQLGIHFNSAILPFKNVKLQEYGKRGTFLFVSDLGVSAL
jgi:hypothetical protein